MIALVQLTKGIMPSMLAQPARQLFGGVMAQSGKNERKPNNTMKGATTMMKPMFLIRPFSFELESLVKFKS